MLGGLATLVGCKWGERPAPGSTGEPNVVENVVARVGNRSIGAADIRARMAADGIDAEAALRQLVDEELWAAEASRLGFSEDVETERAIERRMVRAMLRDLEAESTPASVTDEELRKDFAEHREKFQVPERRRSWHILVSEPGDTGRARAESILRELRSASDPRSVFERYANGSSEGVKAEDLPPISRKAAMQKPYLDALFETESVGLLDRVIETSYGWHAIFVAEIQPAERKTLQDVEEESRKRLSQKKRYERLTRLIDTLEAKGLVQRDDAAVERLVSAKNLPTPATP